MKYSFKSSERHCEFDVLTQFQKHTADKKQIRSVSFPQGCQDVCCWQSWAFPVGDLGSSWSINLDGNNHCVQWGHESLVLDLGKVFEVLCIWILRKHTMQCIWLLLGPGRGRKWILIKYRSAGQSYWLPRWKDSQSCVLIVGRALRNLQGKDTKAQRGVPICSKSCSFTWK